MRKRYWALILITFAIIISLFFMIKLTNRNKKLGYISDDARQVSLLKDIYTEIFNETLTKNDGIKPDNTVYVNFVTYNHYVISQENALNEFLDNYAIEKPTKVYTINNHFYLKDQKLGIEVSYLNDDGTTHITERIYKLKINKKEQKINYKLIDTKKKDV